MLGRDLERRIWNPWGDFASDFKRLQDEMSHLFDRSEGHFTEFPLMNVWVGDDRANITVELPGVEPKDIEVSASGETLTVKGIRRPYEPKKGETYYRQEREYGSFSRTLTLPFEIQAGSVDATYRNGILTITAPRAEADKPKKIAVRLDS